MIIGIMAVSLVFPKFKVLQSKLDRINLIMGERLSGLLVVRAFTRSLRKIVLMKRIWS